MTSTLSKTTKTVLTVVLAILTIIGTSWAARGILVTRPELTQAVAAQNQTIQAQSRAIDRNTETLFLHTRQIEALERMEAVSVCMEITSRNGGDYRLCMLDDTRSDYLREELENNPYANDTSTTPIPLE